MQGEAIHRHRLAHDDLHDDSGDDDDVTNLSHTVLAIPLLDCHRHTQQVYLLTGRHEDYLLFIKRKWIVIKVFMLAVFTLRTLGRGLVCRLRGGRGPTGGGSGRGGGEAGTPRVTLQQYIVISI